MKKKRRLWHWTVFSRDTCWGPTRHHYLSKPGGGGGGLGGSHTRTRPGCPPGVSGVMFVIWKFLPPPPLLQQAKDADVCVPGVQWFKVVIAGWGTKSSECIMWRTVGRTLHQSAALHVPSSSAYTAAGQFALVFDLQPNDIS